MHQRYLSLISSWIVIIVFLAISPQLTFAQTIDTIFGCDDIPASPQGAASCTICNFDILYGNTFPFTPSENADWCGTIENDQYIGFVAGPTGQVVFEMVTFNCANSNGLQVGIYDENNLSVGDCLGQVFPNTSEIFTAQQLYPGNIYYIRIDGFAGDGCEFSIRVISGLINAGPDAPGPIAGPSEVCFDESYPYFINPVANAYSYYWRLTPGIWTAGATVDPPEAANPVTGTTSLNIEVEIPPISIAMPSGSCDVLRLDVFPLNPCFASQDSSSFDIRVCRALQDTFVFEVCLGSEVEFPAGSGDFFSTPFIYQTADVGPSARGCDSFAVLQIIPFVNPQFVDTISVSGSYSACEAGYEYPPSGQLFTEGVYYFGVDTTGLNLCDTAIELTVTRTGDPLPAVSFSGNGIICDSITDVTAVIQQGVPPFIFEWSTGDRDSGTVSSTVIDLSVGTYSLIVIDSLGCSLDTSFVVERFQGALPELEITPSDCNGQGGGVGLVGVDSSAFNILWSTGATSTSISDLSTGVYSLSVSLPNTPCQFDTVFTVPVDTSCYAVIEGYVSSDLMIDCATAQTAFPLADVEVVLNSSRSTFTDPSGYYSFRVDTGTYNVMAVNPHPTLLTPTCIQQHNITIQSYLAPAVRADFYYLRDSISDISIELYATSASVGRSNSLFARVCNNSALDQPVDITLAYDSDKQSVRYTRPTTGQVSTNPGTILFPAVNVPAFGCTFLRVELQSGTTVSIGDTLTYFGWTDSLTTLNDANPVNNHDTTQTVVIAPFDPNVKLVEPSGRGDSNLIAATDTLLEYTIIFQNSGTDDALYVRLEDRLLPELNASTFRPIGASHPYQVNLEDDNTLTVTFDDIRLPPMTEDFEGSKGFFSFEIERAEGLPEGAEITNFADIFFDFNAPIRTPTSRLMLPRTQVVVITPPVDTQQIFSELLLYPNPAKDFFIVRAPTGDSVLTLMLTTVNGTTLPLEFVGGNAAKGNQEFRIGEDHFPSGAYFARIELLSGRVEHVKVVVE